MNIDERILREFPPDAKVVFFTGAGISAESGIPTFRGKDGIWNKLKPEELANFDAFIRNPDVVWEWYSYRKKIISETSPNNGHSAIVEMEKLVEDVKVITQNVDNLHKRAGSNVVFELHGNIERNYCINCKEFYDNIDLTSGVPYCKCGGLIRPDVVWFGEYLPQDQFRLSEDAAKMCDVFVVTGTSGIVYPAASLIFTAKQYGATILEVNVEETEITGYADYSLFGKSGVVLPELISSIRYYRSKQNL